MASAGGRTARPVAAPPGTREYGVCRRVVRGELLEEPPPIGALAVEPAAIFDGLTSPLAPFLLPYQ